MWQLVRRLSGKRTKLKLRAADRKKRVNEMILTNCAVIATLWIGAFSKECGGESVDSTPNQHCTYSAVQSLHKRGTHRTRLAQVTLIAVSSLCA